jgi:uncharacterized DUF497 family protein
MLKFEWDAKKAEINIVKHEVSFEEAVTVFDDDMALYLFDNEHSDNEERFIVIGTSEKEKTLTVCHCYRGENEEIIRIISARQATKKEKTAYEEQLW